jgi:hypothetical protein
VVVEAREEPEAVLAGQVATAGACRAGDRDAAGLAAELLRLVDGDREAALGQLVRRGQPGHATAEDRHGLLRARGQGGTAATEGEPGHRGGGSGSSQHRAAGEWRLGVGARRLVRHGSPSCAVA